MWRTIYIQTFMCVLQQKQSVEKSMESNLSPIYEYTYEFM